MQIYDFEVTDSAVEDKIKQAGFDMELIPTEIYSKKSFVHILGHRKACLYKPDTVLNSYDIIKAIEHIGKGDERARAATAEELLSFEATCGHLIPETKAVAALGEKIHLDSVSGDVVLVRVGTGSSKELCVYPWDVVWNDQVEFLIIFE